MDRIIIGIAGGSGSGKTTIAKKISKAFGYDSVILSHDYYYRCTDGMTEQELANRNYDHPSALETELLIEHLKELKKGNSIMRPTYDFTKHNRSSEYVKVDSAKIIIVEGILIFENNELCDLIDCKIYVDTDADVRFIRRLKRDTLKRGRSMESVIEQYLKTVKPMHDEFVEPSKRKADIIVPEGGQNEIAINMIIDGITKQMLQ